MKSTFLLGILAPALAEPPVAERHLTDFMFGNQTVGTISGTPCNFMSTADIFSFRVDAGFSDNGGIIELDHNHPLFPGGYNHIGTADAADWHTGGDAIHLGTFNIVLQLTKMQTADENYNYFKFNNDEWSDETDFSNVQGSSTARDKIMASVCFYKNSEPTECNDADYTQEIMVPLPTIGATVEESTQPTLLSIRKVLGVASQCGVGDDGYDLTGGAEDIFAWTTLEASNTLHYNIAVTNTDAVGEDGSTGAHDLAIANKHTSGTVTYELTVAHDHQVHDLLFVDGEVAVTAEEGGNFENVPEGSLAIDYSVGYSIDGDVTRTAQSVSQTDKCSSTLTVDAMGGTNTNIPAEHSATRDAVWHCFRGTGSNFFPTTNPASAGTVKEQDSEQYGALESLNEAAQTFTHNACSAKLVVDCDLAGFIIAGTDDRDCIADPSGEGEGATTDEVDGAPGTIHFEEDCIQSKYWLRKYEYLAYNPIGITYEAAIIQAVRLRDSRQYPKDAKAADASDNTVTSLFGGAEGLSASVDSWECDDATCSNDPYKILAVADTGSAGISCPSSGDLIGGNAANAQGDYSVSQPTWTQNCTVDTPTQISIQAELQAPPAKYPESYVFAAVSYTETKATTAGPKITEREGNVTETGAITTADGVDHIHTVDSGDEEPNANNTDATNAAARRLRSAKATGSTVHYFSVTDAVQHGISE